MSNTRFGNPSNGFLDVKANPKFRLSIVLVTSAIPMHPKTDLIDLVIASLDLVEGVRECELIIVCDKMKIIESDKKTNWKSGKVHESSQLRYEEYIQNLRKKYLNGGYSSTSNLISNNDKNSHPNDPPDTRIEEYIQSGGSHLEFKENNEAQNISASEEEILSDIKELKLSRNDRRSKVRIFPMTSHMGFAYSLREGLKLVTTEYVMVMQHDRAFSEQLDIHPILDLFDREKNIKYIGFQTAATKQYVYKKLKSKYRMKTSEKDLITGDLIPIMYWYDSTHICRTKDYLDLIKRECKIGQFIETTYGGKIEKEIAKEIENGNWNFKFHMDNYGMFLWYDENIGLDNPMCRHLDGRGFYTMEARIKEGWPAMNHHLYNVRDIIQKIHKKNS